MQVDEPTKGTLADQSQRIGIGDAERKPTGEKSE
jgi:hypothetical protein